MIRQLRRLPGSCRKGQTSFPPFRAEKACAIINPRGGLAALAGTIDFSYSPLPRVSSMDVSNSASRPSKPLLECGTSSPSTKLRVHLVDDNQDAVDSLATWMSLFVYE